MADHQSKLSENYESDNSNALRRARKYSSLLLCFVLPLCGFLLLVIFLFNIQHDSQESQKYQNEEDLDHHLEERVIRNQAGIFDGFPIHHLLGYIQAKETSGVSCKHNESSRLVILVQTACGNFGRRQAIRQTWGLDAQRLGVSLLFFVAVGNCSVSSESHQYRDIVQVNHVDSYFNLTLKSLSRLLWFQENCQNTEYLLMSDDDVYQKVDLILNYLEEVPMYPEFCAFGWKYDVSTPVRDPTHKWYVPKWVFAPDVFPEYLAGPSYIMCGHKVKPVYEACLRLKYITIEDVLINGIAGDLAGVRKMKEPRFLIDSFYANLVKEEDFLSIYNFTEEEMKTYWKHGVKKLL